MNEGITLENVSEVHILDVYYNFGRVEQVIGRAIRQCKHYNVTSENNPYPKVDIYKYVVRLENKLSSEENLYRKAELKYLLVKKIERSLKRVSIDCAINYNGNVFKDDIEKNKNCIEPTIGEDKKKNLKFCDVKCDFTNCDYNCYDNKINLNYYDKNSKLFKKINKIDLDYTTFTDLLAKNEINFAKEKIKLLYKKKYVYKLDEILNNVKNNYKGEEKELFEDWFVYQALELLLPTTENDFTKFNDRCDFIYDKYNNPGYLIYRGTFYIFQPQEISEENIPLFYRKIYNKELSNQLTLYSYLKSEKINKEIKKIKNDNSNSKYDFISIKKYYDEREENTLIGILDKNKNNDEIFKLRNKKQKNIKAKRGEGIQSLKGAVCHTSNDKNDIKNMFKLLDIKFDKDMTRIDLCTQIKEKLLFLEKYSTGKNNKTYTIIPFNHNNFIFPLNLEDRIRYVRDKFNTYEKSKTNFNISKKNNGIFLNKRDKSLASYEVSFTFKDKITKNSEELLDKYSFIKKGNNYTSIFE